MSATPTIVLAAPSSGSGKTTITTGLIGALRAAGHRVAPYKVGPDYIDPGYHALAAGRIGRNLDPNLVGAERVAPLFAAGCVGADVAIVEGVMGLFDGRLVGDIGSEAVSADLSDPLGLGSTAHVATLLGAPVVLVVDAAGHSQSLAALLHGFLSYDTSVRIAGVILNRVGSTRHEWVLRQACGRVGLPVLGVVQRNSDLMVPSRHLGLIPAAERRPDAQQAVDAMTQAIAGTVDLPGVLAAAQTATLPPGVQAWTASAALADAAAATPAAGSPAPHAAPVIAVAGGAAFTFGYAEHVELLTAAGAEVQEFDPCADALPPRTAGLVLGGGFPEAHAELLAANTVLRADIAAQAARGLPIHAECAGLLYLTGDLDGQPMSGVLAATGHFGPTLTLGYRDAVAVEDSLLYRAGERVCGHEFHRSTVAFDPSGHCGPAWAWRGPDGRSRTDGAATARLHASYLHTHPAGFPAAITRFVAAAMDYAAGTAAS